MNSVSSDNNNYIQQDVVQVLKLVLDNLRNHLSDRYSVMSLIFSWLLNHHPYYIAVLGICTEEQYNYKFSRQIDERVNNEISKKLDSCNLEYVQSLETGKQSVDLLLCRSDYAKLDNPNQTEIYSDAVIEMIKECNCKIKNAVTTYDNLPTLMGILLLLHIKLKDNEFKKYHGVYNQLSKYIITNISINIKSV
jgi:glycerol-3-phosphate dehydrogenase